MVRFHKRIALSVAGICLLGASAQAQLTAYSTGFDGADIVNGAPTAATYNSPTATPTDPLDGQNGWTTNDTAATGTATQLVGQSDFVGTLGPTAYFSGQNGVLGGIYRTTAPTAGAPDVVPSTASGGVIGLYHTVNVPAMATFVSLDVDFAVTAPTNFTNQDTFGLALRSASGASIVSFNFSPGTTPTTIDDVGLTIGTTAQTPTTHITLNGTYHLTFNVNTRTNAFTASIQSSGGGAALTFADNLPAGAALTIAQFAATWNLGDKTTLNSTANGYQNASDDSLIFDNLAVAVPEPSAYAMLALGLIGGAAVLRSRRQQA